MKQWEINEQLAYQWFKETRDPHATLQGGSDSKAPDIIASNGDIYEVKSLHAQCGQFTAATAHQYQYSNEVQEYFLGAYNRDCEIGENFYLKDHFICKQWVKAYYKDIKKVKAFLVVNNGKVTEESLEDYFNNHSFSCTYRRKKSGSSSTLPKWAIKYLPEHWKCIQEGTKYYATNPTVHGERVQGYNTKGDLRIISVEKNNQIKVLSETYTPTFIFSVR